MDLFQHSIVFPTLFGNLVELALLSKDYLQKELSNMVGLSFLRVSNSQVGEKSGEY